MIICLLWTLAWGAPAITLNGVDVSALRDQRFKAVDVWIDAEGNVHLSSERYQVQPAKPPEAPPPATAPAAASGAPAAPRVDPAVTANPQPVASPDVARPTRIEPGTPDSTPVPPGTWWLATEDNASRGHEIRVYLNGTLVRTIKSGEEQVIEDISKHLRRGENRVMLQTRSLGAGGGGLYVYLGRGGNEGGTVTLSQPDIQHGLGASKQGDDVREYTLRVE